MSCTDLNSIQTDYEVLKVRWDKWLGQNIKLWNTLNQLSDDELHNYFEQYNDDKNMKDLKQIYNETFKLYNCEFDTSYKVYKLLKTRGELTSTKPVEDSLETKPKEPSKISKFFSSMFKKKGKPDVVKTPEVIVDSSLGEELEAKKKELKLKEEQIISEQQKIEKEKKESEERRTGEEDRSNKEKLEKEKLEREQREKKLEDERAKLKEELEQAEELVKQQNLELEKAEKQKEEKDETVVKPKEVIKVVEKVVTQNNGSRSNSAKTNVSEHTSISKFGVDDTGKCAIDKTGKIIDDGIDCQCKNEKGEEKKRCKKEKCDKDEYNPDCDKCNTKQNCTAGTREENRECMADKLQCQKWYCEEGKSPRDIDSKKCKSFCKEKSDDPVCKDAHDKWIYKIVYNIDFPNSRETFSKNLEIIKENESIYKDKIKEKLYVNNISDFKFIYVVPSISRDFKWDTDDDKLKDLKQNITTNTLIFNSITSNRHRDKSNDDFKESLKTANKYLEESKRLYEDEKKKIKLEIKFETYNEFGKEEALEDLKINTNPTLTLSNGILKQEDYKKAKKTQKTKKTQKQEEELDNTSKAQQAPTYLVFPPNKPAKIPDYIIDKLINRLKGIDSVQSDDDYEYESGSESEYEDDVIDFPDIDLYSDLYKYMLLKNEKGKYFIVINSINEHNVKKKEEKYEQIGYIVDPSLTTRDKDWKKLIKELETTRDDKGWKKLIKKLETDKIKINLREPHDDEKEIICKALKIDWFTGKVKDHRKYCGTDICEVRSFKKVNKCIVKPSTINSIKITIKSFDGTDDNIFWVVEKGDNVGEIYRTDGPLNKEDFEPPILREEKKAICDALTKTRFKSISSQCNPKIFDYCSITGSKMNTSGKKCSYIDDTYNYDLSFKYDPSNIFAHRYISDGSKWKHESFIPWKHNSILDTHELSKLLKKIGDYLILCVENVISTGN